ncbi:hypothetical protein ACFV0K_18605, partial [Streptomyces sp. NPDC059586]
MQWSSLLCWGLRRRAPRPPPPAGPRPDAGAGRLNRRNTYTTARPRPSTGFDLLSLVMATGIEPDI